MAEDTGGGNEDGLLSSQAYITMDNDWETILEEADTSGFASICQYFSEHDNSEMKRTDSCTSLDLGIVIKDDIVPTVLPEHYVLQNIEHVDTEVLSQQLNTKIAGSRPANQDWEGIYKFNISFEKEGKLTNGTDWTFSGITKKLYVNMDTSCPILFCTKKSPPVGSIIRASPAFLKPKHTSEVVQRCLLHKNPDDPSNLNANEIADHLIRCEAMQATYHCESVTQRRSVTVPYFTPVEGMDYICYVYKFMCFCSCTGGGISKRPLQIIFTLENKGEVIGRKVLNIRVCASPGRDRKTEEEKELSGKKMLSTKRGQVTDNGHCSKINNTKRLKASSGDDVYILHVKGKKNYKTLKYLNELMQFKDAARNVKEEEDSS